jgi:poly(hydroxyalkanoate) depolymerase family esterase
MTLKPLETFAEPLLKKAFADSDCVVSLLPQQPATNNLAKCFHWYREKDNRRDSGEALSIKQMVDQMKVDYKIDTRKVYVTGLSAGAAMTGVMLATYPDVFAGGAMMAGVPYGCATKLSESLGCMQARTEKTPAQWGDFVRHATDRRGTWPIVSIWQGTADYIIAPGNAQQEKEQWTNVHGLSQTPTTNDTVGGFPHEVFRNRDGKNVVELYSITDMGHGQAVNPGSEPPNCGSTEAFFYNVHLCSAYQVAKFWGIDR